MKIKKSKNSTAIGPDGICNLPLRNLGPNGMKVLTNLINESIAQCVIPSIWKTATMCLSPKREKTRKLELREVKTGGTVVPTGDDDDTRVTPTT